MLVVIVAQEGVYIEYILRSSWSCIWKKMATQLRVPLEHALSCLCISFGLCNRLLMVNLSLLGLPRLATSVSHCMRLPY
jgi:hypothetical protein